MPRRRILTVLACAVVAAAAPTARGATPGVCVPSYCSVAASQTSVSIPEPKADGYLALTTTGVVGRFGVGLGPSHRHSDIHHAAAFTASTSGLRWWVASADGVVRAGGRARSYGSIPKGKLKGRIVAMAGTPTGNGYYLLSDRGRVYAFGDARYHGGTAAPVSNAVGIAVTSTGSGYWIVTATGAVSPHGDAPAMGHLDHKTHPGKVVSIAAARSGLGFWLLTDRGSVEAFGAAPSHGSARLTDATAIVGTYDDRGYWIATASGRVAARGHAARLGSLAKGHHILALRQIRRFDSRQAKRPTRLVIKVGASPKGASGVPRIVVSGPGYQRTINSTTVINGARRGRWTIVADAMKVGDDMGFAQYKTTNVTLGHAGRGTVHVDYNEVVSGKVRVATSGAIISVSGPVANRYTVVVHDPGRQLTPGTVLAVGSQPNAVKGALVHVTGVTREGDIATATGPPASLTEIGPQATITAQPTVNLGGLDIDHASAPPLKRPGVHTPPTAKTADSAPSFQCSNGVGAYVGVNVKSIGIDNDFDVSWGGLYHPLTIYAHWIATLSESAKISVGIAGKASCSWDKSLLGKPKEFSPWEFAVGPVPVVITPQLDLKLHIDGSVGGQIQTGVTESASASAGLRWDGSSLHPVADLTKSWDYDAPYGMINGDLKASVGPDLEFAFYGIAGPYLSADAFGDFNVDTSQSPWWTLKAGFEAGIGFRFDAFGFNFDKGIPDLLEKSWTIAQADTPAPPTVTTPSLSGGTIGDDYSQTLSVVHGKGPIYWNISKGSLPAGLRLDPWGGKISGTPTVAGTSSFTVEVSDQNGLWSDRDYTIGAVYGAPKIQTTDLDDGLVNHSYSETLTSKDGQSPVTWSVTSGSLPTGLSLSSGGTISGKPTAAGTTTFTVRAKGANGLTSDKKLTLSTAWAPPQITTKSPLSQAQVGVAYSTRLASTDGQQPITWSVTGGSLPAGLSLDAATGTISGTPTAKLQTPATATLTVRATGANGRYTEAPLALTITPAVPAVTTTSLDGGIARTAYHATLALDGGQYPITWSVSSGSLPDGLALNRLTGDISGTPTAISTNLFTVLATDARGLTSSHVLTLSVTPAAPTVTTTSLPNARSAVAYDQQLAVADGLAPIVWSVSSGTLPDGLSLNASTGRLTGTPTDPAVGTSTFTVKATDARGWSDSHAITLVVDPPLPIITTPRWPTASPAPPTTSRLPRRAESRRTRGRSTPPPPRSRGV